MTEHIRFTFNVDLMKFQDNGRPMPTNQVLEYLNAYHKKNKQLKEENEHYKSMFFEIVETALTDKNCRELYCKGVLDIFDKCDSLNQAREQIKEMLK